jgi:hypothetical protein
MALTIAVALLASVCFAVASVLQHHGARGARRRFPLHVGLLVELAGKPGWLAGVLAQAAGVALHLLAVTLTGVWLLALTQRAAPPADQAEVALTTGSAAPRGHPEGRGGQPEPAGRPADP